MFKDGIPADFLARQSGGFHGGFQTGYRMQRENMEQQQSQGADTTHCERELAAERERYLRLAADFDNYRKRTIREQDRKAASQKEAVVRDLLPSIDNLERALAAHSGENLQDGVQMIYQQIIETLKRHGFEPRNDLGQPFDARFHDAIAVGFKNGAPDSAVIDVWERGWMRGTELFRPAKVLVNKTNDGTSPAFDSELKEVANV